MITWWWCLNGLFEGCKKWWGEMRRKDDPSKRKINLFLQLMSRCDAMNGHRPQRIHMMHHDESSDGSVDDVSGHDGWNDHSNDDLITGCTLRHGLFVTPDDKDHNRGSLATPESILSSSSPQPLYWRNSLILLCVSFWVNLIIWNSLSLSIIRKKRRIIKYFLHPIQKWSWVDYE